MSDSEQELEKTTDATADEATSETETNDAIESVPADSMQFSVTFDDVDDEGTVDDGIVRHHSDSSCHILLAGSTQRRCCGCNAAAGGYGAGAGREDDGG